MALFHAGWGSKNEFDPGVSVPDDGSAEYLAAEARSRMAIDRQLAAAGWVVQHRKDLNLFAGQGVAVREYGRIPDPRTADPHPGPRPAGGGRHAPKPQSATAATFVAPVTKSGVSRGGAGY